MDQAIADNAAQDPPRQLLNQLDLTSTKTAPGKDVLALELELRGLCGKVKRSGPNTQNPGKVTSTNQDMIDALRSY